MVRRGLLGIAAGLGLALCVSAVLPRTVGAHERRQVGSYVMRVGWSDEPTFAGVKNAVQVLLSDASGKPVTDLPEDLKVEIIFGTQKTSPLPLEAAFGKTFGRPGDFRAAVIPTRPGTYTFHFIGALGGQRVDQSFTSSDKTFDPVQEATGIEFPAKDPSPGELAGRLDRVASRVDSAQTATQNAAAAARQARILGVVGVIAGIAGVVAASVNRRRVSAR